MAASGRDVRGVHCVNRAGRLSSVTMQAFVRTTLVVAAGATLVLAGCETSATAPWENFASAHGVRVTNQTDRIVRAELVQLRPNGEMTTWSTQTVSPGAEFKDVVDGEERRPGMRVRFTLADQTVADGNWVLLNLPDKKDRVYDLVLIGNHLSAREQRRGEKPKLAQ